MEGAKVDEFYSSGALYCNSTRTAFHANRYLLVRDKEKPSHCALGRYERAHARKVAQSKKLLRRAMFWGHSATFFP